MVKTREILIIITFFSLWLTNYFAAGSQSILAFSLLFSVGLIHGSNDLQLLNKTFFKTKRTTFFTQLGLYLLVVFTAFALFFWLPVVALTLFILVSGYHFGEQHWDEFFGRSVWNKMFYASYGLGILFLLFYLNPEDTTAVIEQLTAFAVPKDWFVYGLIGSGAVFGLLLIKYAYQQKIAPAKLAQELLLLVVFTILFYWASLVWAFTIYFIFWHSIPSIKEQVQYLYGKVTKKSVLKYLRGAVWVWLISMVGLLVFFKLMESGNQSFLTIFFSFLGAITFAHTVIISRMFDQQN
ncbi:Brp/Blh family beta-carotene 15,15'-dioxygenase [Gilvibacter sediminis]|uniref:Brp/Blh family beta-carotene 15,15'-dioxygenase n=1 Tax=Gilvibacter sediminis TaxID=379071 RepID=UPI002351033F|nr:Brp/Blh family beta-carotene 15,15'-dioxygenase [Gilvibacter sediminis]MDC7998006.1 Brp/Blh family beta-carotene 15,15'-dioxygenase [Gilvibacter sediminis]